MSALSQSTDNKDLGRLFSVLIGIQEHVDPEMVTPLWIHKQREERFYPNTRYGHTSYGTTLSFTQNEFEQLSEAVDDLLASA